MLLFNKPFLKTGVYFNVVKYILTQASANMTSRHMQRKTAV